jgi:hypothetical protein
MVPAFEVTRLPAIVWYDEDPDAGLVGRRRDGTQIVVRPDLFSDIPDIGPHLALIRREIVVGAHE